MPRHLSPAARPRRGHARPLKHVPMSRNHPLTPAPAKLDFVSLSLLNPLPLRGGEGRVRGLLPNQRDMH